MWAGQVGVKGRTGVDKGWKWREEAWVETDGCTEEKLGWRGW